MYGIYKKHSFMENYNGDDDGDDDDDDDGVILQ